MKILLLIRPVPNSKESSQKPKPSWPFEPKPQLNTSFLELRAIVCASPQDILIISFESFKPLYYLNFIKVGDEIEKFLQF